MATPFGVSHVAQHAAVASLAATGQLLERVDRIVEERGRMLECLRDQGWYLPDSQANFVWLPLGDRTEAPSGAGFGEAARRSACRTRCR